MRTRLLCLLLAFMACVFAAIAVPAARSLASGVQQTVYLDRLNDTTHFAALAEQNDTPADITALRADLARYDEVYGVAAAVVGRDGSLTYASPTGVAIDPATLRPSLSAALAGRPSDNPPLIWPWDKRPLVVAAPIVQSDDVIGAAVTISPVARLHTAVLRGWAAISVIAGIALVLGVLLAIRLTGWILRPVYLLDTATHTIATGRFDARVSKATGPPELRRLATSFNKMADHVEAAIEQQRAFVADASHQLRNPLSALLLRMEHLGTAVPAGWEEELQYARDEGARLTQILDDLLDLATAEHVTAQDQRFDVVAIADERIHAWSAMAENKQIDLCRIGVGSGDVLADDAAVRGVMDVLISNAIKFSLPGTAVTVTIAEEGTFVVIEVADQGPGLSPDELDRLGDRFWRSARHQNVEGSGLGIAIARTLLTSVGGDLEFAAAEPAGLVATVRLRRAFSSGSGEEAAPVVSSYGLTDR
jgi:signal transduction histidine kinase